MEKEFSVQKRLFWFLAVITLFRIFVGASFELSLDEAYYWQWSKNLSLSYYDHPPMIAVVIALTTFFSDAAIFIRLPAILGAVVSSWLLYRLTVELYDNEIAGFRAVWIANLTLIFAIGALIPTPDTPLIPFYTAGVLVFWMAANSDPHEKDSYIKWIAAGALVGGALLSKYTAFFFFPCALFYLLLAGERRKWLTKIHPYLAAVVSLLVFSPVIIWNAGHNWISLFFQAGHGFSKSTENNPFIMFGEFVLSQTAFYSIGIFFFLVAAFIAITRRSFAKGVEPKIKDVSLFLFSFSAPIILFFLMNSFRSRMEGNWPVLGFIPLFVQAGLMVPQWHLRAGVRRAWFASLALAVLLFAFIHLQLVNPIIPHPQRHEISRRIYGWELLAKKVEKAASENNATFIISNRYQITSLMAYYTNPNVTSYVLEGNELRYFFLPDTQSQLGNNAVYLTEEERDEINRIKSMFEWVEKAETVGIVRKEEVIRRFAIYRCYNYQGGLK